jgi:BlaI family transcriptional regulator, penicillinase repressor
MARRPSPHLNEVEFKILSVLWERGPSTVREVHEALRSEGGASPSSPLKMMQVMTQKGLLLRDDSQRPQVYRAAISQDQAQVEFVDDLIQRVFHGSADKLVLRAISSRYVSAKDLAEIRKLLSDYEGGSE